MGRLRPRVLVVAPFPPPVTGQSLVTEMAAAALAVVADVERVDTADRSMIWRRPWALPGHRAVQWVSLAARVRRALRRVPVDVVYLTPASSILGLVRDLLVVAAIPAGTPIVAHVHAGDYGRLLRGRWGPVARAMIRRFQHVLTPSAYAAEAIRRAMPGLDPTVVPNTVRPKLRFTPAHVEAAWQERRGRRPTVLFLSNMIPSKGYGLLAEAARRLRHDVDLVFAGAWADHDERAAFERRLRDLDLDARVVGAVDAAATRTLLRDASVLAFPSTYPHESLPLAVLEAKAAGCAVVAVDHAGLGEMVRDGVDGRLVRQADAAAFAAALDATLDDAERLGRAGAAHVRDAFAPVEFGRALRTVMLGTEDRPLRVSSGGWGRGAPIGETRGG